jgi:hypothetical protein
MAQVYSKQLGKVIEVSDDEYAQLSAVAGPSPTGTPDMAQPDIAQPEISQETSVTPPQTTTDTTQSVANPYGFSLEELYEGQARAIASGNNNAIKRIQKLIDLEEGYGGTMMERKEASVEKEPNPEDVHLMNTLETLFFGTPDQESLAFARQGFGGRVPGMARRIGSFISPGAPGSPEERLQNYIRTMESIRPQLVAMAGDVGNKSWQEQLQAGKGLPMETDTPSEAIQMMKIARQKFRLPPSPYLDQLEKEILEGRRYEEGKQIKDYERNIADRIVDAGIGTAQTVGNFARNQFNTTENVIRDVAQTPLARARNQSNEQLLEQAELLMNQAANEKDPNRQQEMFAQAQDLFSQVTREAEDIAGGFSEDIDKSVARRAIGTGVELGLGAQLGGSVATKLGASPGATLFKMQDPQIVKQAINVAKGLPGKTLGNIAKPFKGKPAEQVLGRATNLMDEGRYIRTGAIDTAEKAGSKVSGNTVYKSVVQWAENAKSATGSAGRKQIDDFVKTAEKYYKGKNLKPTTAKTRWDKARKAYTDSGKVGNTVEAGYHQAIRDGVRSELDTITKGAFEKGTSMISEAKKMEKLFKQIADSRAKKEITKELSSPITDFAKKTGERSLQLAGAAVPLYIAGKLLNLQFPGAAYREE